MKEVKEIKINVPEGQLISVEVKDGVCTLRFEVAEEIISEVKKAEIVSSIQEEDDIFVCIKASELSLDDKFMQYQPKTEREKKVKGLLEKVIKKGMEDFWRPKIDPSLDEAKNICFKAGEKPVVGKSYNWWRESARNFNSKRNSMLGTKSQYIAFLGVLIKALVAEGWRVSDAWYVVCNNSKELGHYCNAENAKRYFEPTGSRAIAGFYDLANTKKILAEDEEAGGFCVAGGGYYDDSNNRPLACLGHRDCCRDNLYYGVGWLVLS